MRLIIDSDARTLTARGGSRVIEMSLYSTRAFELLSAESVRVGWNQKYTYTFSWLGRPIIQLPSDLVRLQEVIFRLQPDVSSRPASRMEDRSYFTRASARSSAAAE